MQQKTATTRQRPQLFNFLKSLTLLLVMTATLAYVTSGCGSDQTATEKTAAENRTERNAADAGGSNPSDKPGGKACIPSKSMWEQRTKNLVTEHCGRCHGEKPNFGAPYSLLNYDDLLIGEPGKRKIDRMVARMANKTMPPAGSPVPSHNALDTMTEWASCGLTHPDHSIGLQSSREVFKAPEKADSNWDKFDVVAPKFSVGEKVLDLYQCFVIEAPVNEDRFIRRIETIIDESRVLHHIVLLLDKENLFKDKKTFPCKGLPSNADYLYAWAPGAKAIQFSDGGLRLKKGQRFVLQIHYNNGAGVKNAVDSSGIRIHHSKPQGKEYGMFSPGPVAFSIPAGETKDITGHCKLSEDTKIIAGMPHMHEIGSKFFQEIIRKDGTKEELIKLTGWSFESQFFYKTPFELKAGDTITTTCTFANKSKGTVRSGSGTKDEMCFNFLYATPPPKSRFCDGAQDPNSPGKPYKPGACVPKDNTAKPPAVIGTFQVGEPATTAGGTIPKANWMLKKITIFSDKTRTPFGEIDTKASGIQAKGQLITGEKTILDVNMQLTLKTSEGLGFTRDIPSSISGKLKENSSKANEVTLTPDCGSKNSEKYKFDVKDNTIRLISRRSFAGLVIKFEFIFEKQ